MSKQTQTSNILSVSFLITGNSVGSGLLALPICVGLSGIIPGVVVLIISCVFMTATGIILVGLVNQKRSSDFDLPSIYGTVLGSSFKWIAIIANLIVLYGLLVAYLSCLNTIASVSFGFDSVYDPLIIFIIITSVNFFAIHVVKHCNSILVVLLFVSFIFLIIFTGKHVQTENLVYLNWLLVFISLPVLVNSFNFHNMVPIACRLLNFNHKRTVTAIVIGISLSFVLNIIWCFVVIGVLKYSGGENSILTSFKCNLPATVPLGKIFKSEIFLVFSVIFAAIAVITSYWTVGAALTSFIQDLRHTLFKKNENRILDIILTFCPPLLITIMCPNIFISIQDVIGGIGIAILFGLLPGFILLKRKGALNKIFAVVLIAFFTIVFLFAILQRTGVLELV